MTIGILFVMTLLCAGIFVSGVLYRQQRVLVLGLAVFATTLGSVTWPFLCMA